MWFYGFSKLAYRLSLQIFYFACSSDLMMETICATETSGSLNYTALQPRRRWVVVDVDYILESSHCVYVGNIADVSTVLLAGVFGVKVSTVSQNTCISI
jgi:hypothetical protein